MDLENIFLMQIKANRAGKSAHIASSSRYFEANGGVTIMATQSNRPPIFGMKCAQCGDLLIAPEWSEYEDERHILNLWSCTNCGCQFETEALLPAAKAVSDAATMKAFFPSLLV